MSYELIKIEYDDGVAVLTLNDPSAMNAVSEKMIVELKAVMNEIEDPANGVRCLVLTGEGRGFCAGANIMAEGSSAQSDEVDAGEILDKHYHPFLRRIRALHCPLVTAVNGPAAGVGMSFALMGDLIVAGKSAFFLQAFRRIGLVPDGGSTYLLPRLIGLARARELSLLGERLPAQKAFEWGLINRVVEDEDLMPTALDLARQLANGPTRALGLIHKLYWESPENSYEEQVSLERRSQHQAGLSPDFKEGVTAFAEKRDAKFTGE